MHISSWQSFRTAELLLCGSVYNSIDIKQPRDTKFGMEWFELKNTNKTEKPEFKRFGFFLFPPLKFKISSVSIDGDALDL